MKRGNVAIKFKPEDAKACFRCQVNSPQSRLISLEKLPTEGGTLELDCLVELLCPSCLRLEIDDFCEGFVQSSIPVGANETPAEDDVAAEVDGERLEDAGLRVAGREV
jgi:hypothetical protein